MAKHVLYVSYDGMTDPLGQSQVLPYLIGLSKKGYRFSLISFEKPDRFQQSKNTIQEICEFNNIAWYPQNYTKRPPILSTVYDVRKMMKQATRIHHEAPIQIVHCRSYISALVGVRFKKSYSIPWVFDMRGFWADERVEGNIWNLKNPLYKFIYSYFKKKEKIYLTNAEAIVSLTNAGKKELLSWKIEGVASEKITVIPCCVDLNLFNPEQVDSVSARALKESLDLTESYVVGYVGSIGTWYKLEEMLITFKRLVEIQANATFLFVTKESEFEIFKHAIRLSIHPSKLRITSCLHSEVPLHISLFDCSIFYIQPSFSKTASSPTKQGELMAMGVPIICNSGVGDTEAIIQQYQSGVVVDISNQENLKTNNYSMDSFNRNRSIQGARDYFGLENGISRYDLIYKTLLD